MPSITPLNPECIECELPSLPDGFFASRVASMHAANKTLNVPTSLVPIILNSAMQLSEHNTTERINDRWEASGSALKVMTMPEPTADPSINLNDIPHAVDYLFATPGQHVELLSFDPREAGCTALPCSKCQRYHTQVKTIFGREAFACMDSSTLGVTKISGRGRRSFALGLRIECLEGYCKHVGSTLDADFLRLLPREISLQYPCDPTGAEGNNHVSRRFLCTMRSLGRGTDVGASAIELAELEADAEDFELATMLLSAANGKHWRHLSATVGDEVWVALTSEQQVSCMASAPAPVAS